MAADASELLGVVHGGQSPIVGSAVTLYAAGQPVDAVPTQLASTTTDAQGNFSFSGFSCASSSNSALLYLVVSGGDSGGGANSAIELMAALGPCAQTPAYAVVNELTTVAAVYALNAFSYVGSGSTGELGGCVDCAPGTASDMTQLHGNSPAIGNAFGTAALLADVTTGNPATFLPPAGGCTAGAVGPLVNCSAVQKLTALANSLAACVNSAGSTSAQCTALFDCATPGSVFNRLGTSCTVQSGAVPADTLAAMLSIARNPGLVSIPGVYNVATRSIAFSPGLASAPTDWTVAVNFDGGPTGSGLYAATDIAIDAQGNAWITNFANYNLVQLYTEASGFCGQALLGTTPNANEAGASVVELSPTGTPLSGPNGYTGMGLSSPCGIAIDMSGNVWVANTGNSSVTRLVPGSSGQISTWLNTGAGGLSFPGGIAIDPQGNVWVANFSSTKGTIGSTLTELKPDGLALSPSTGFMAQPLEDIWPANLAIDTEGNVWVGGGNFTVLGGGVAKRNATDGSYQFFQAPGQVPFVAVDQRGDLWGSLPVINSVYELNGAGETLSPVIGFTGGGLNFGAKAGAVPALPQSIAIDSSGNVWVADFGTNSVTELNSAGIPLSPASGFTGGGLGSPEGIAVDGAGDVWVTNFNLGTSQGGGGVTEIIGAAAPTVTPLVAQITKPAPTLVSIAVTPANPTIILPATQQFTATGTYSDGSTNDVTASVTWTSSNTSVATVSSPGGLATSVAAGGPVTITASVSQNGQTISGTTQLTVIAPPTISKSFGASSIAVNASTSLTFTIGNPNAAAALTGVGFTDTFPAGLSIGTGATVTTTCASGTASGTAGSSTVSLSGATLAAGASCQVAVSAVTAGSAGTLTNIVQVTSAQGPGNTATATLSVTGVTSSLACFAAPSPQGGGANAWDNQSYCATISNGSADSGYVFTGTLTFTTDINGNVTQCEYATSGTQNGQAVSTGPTACVATGPIQANVSGVGAFTLQDAQNESNTDTDFSGTFSVDALSLSGSFVSSAFGPGAGAANASFSGTEQ